jgi:hypothetical protein
MRAEDCTLSITFFRDDMAVAVWLEWKECVQVKMRGRSVGARFPVRIFAMPLKMIESDNVWKSSIKSLELESDGEE